MVRRVLTIALATAVAAPLLAQSRPQRAPKSTPATRPTPVITAPPSDDSLAAITRRGRAISVADSVAWLGSGAMTSLSLPPDGIRRLIARQTDRGWEVASGKLSSDETAFLITRLATPGIQANHWASSLFEPPQPDTGYFARAARAIETSLTMFRPSSAGRISPPSFPRTMARGGWYTSTRLRYRTVFGRAAATCGSGFRPTAGSSPRPAASTRHHRIQRPHRPVGHDEARRRSTCRQRQRAGGHRRLPRPPAPAGTARAHDGRPIPVPHRRRRRH